MSAKEKDLTTRVPKNHIKYARYKWEFIRRNKEYLSDWKNLTVSFGETRLNFSFFFYRDVREVEEIWNRWKITPLNPDFSFEEHVSELSKKKYVKNPEIHLFLLVIGSSTACNIKRDSFWEYAEDVVLKNGTVLKRYKVKDSFGETGKIEVEIDLNYSKQFLLEEFERLIDKYKFQYERKYWDRTLMFCKQRGLTTPPSTDCPEIEEEFNEFYAKCRKERNFRNKYHFENFDDYIKVYDMRNEKISWAKIKSDLKLNSVQTARNYYKAACGLIEKGIDLYVK